MEAVTIDTNILPAKALMDLASECGFSLQLVTVTGREIEGTDLVEEASSLGQISETWVFGEGRFGEAVLGDIRDAKNFESILHTLSSGSFPKNRDKLTSRQLNQLRDAIILQSHVRTGNSIFVSNDERGFIRHGKREAFEQQFNIKIFNRDEFVAYCQQTIATLSEGSAL